jgi:hypothetical protein
LFTRGGGDVGSPTADCGEKRGAASRVLQGAVEAAAQGDKETLLVLVWKVGKVGFGWH